MTVINPSLSQIARLPQSTIMMITVGGDDEFPNDDCRPFSGVSSLAATALSSPLAFAMLLSSLWPWPCCFLLLLSPCLSFLSSVYGMSLGCPWLRRLSRLRLFAYPPYLPWPCPWPVLDSQSSRPCSCHSPHCCLPIPFSSRFLYSFSIYPSRPGELINNV